MKHTKNHMSSVYQYLESCGVLETGDADRIAQCRKKYWREQKKKWKKEREGKMFELFFNLDELGDISKAAKAYKVSCTKYIKQSCLFHTYNRPYIPDQVTLNHILQLLKLNYSAVQRIQNARSGEANEALLQHMENIEQEIIGLLYSQRSIEEWLSSYLRNNPERKTELMQLFQNCEL